MKALDDLSPHYTMRFPYVALAIKPNANEMYMRRKWIYLYYTFFLIRIKYFGSHIKILCTFFS